VRVYTRGGDDGTTGLADGSRVGKDAVRVVAYGEIDELNAALGVLRANSLPTEVDEPLSHAQAVLFEIGAALADPRGRFALGEEVRDPGWIEAWIDSMDEKLTDLRNFVVPGGSREAAEAHVARTVCRRAERSVVTLTRSEPASAQVVPLLNRLSDALFVLARWLNRRAGRDDVVWRARS
jgi:cob(I)alamin adenosyltransferase